MTSAPSAATRSPSDPTPSGGRARSAPAALGILMMLAAVALFSTMDALAKALTPEYGTLQVLWARYAGQALVVMVLLAPRLRRVLGTRRPVVQVLRSVLMFSATALFFASLPHIGLAEATAIADLAPVLITLGAALFLGERVGPRRIAGIAVALVGALLIVRPGTEVFTPAALLPLGAAVCYAGVILLTRWIRHDDGVWTSLVFGALFGTLVTTAQLPWHWTTPAPLDAAGLAAIGLLGASAQFCLIRAFSLAEAAAIAPLSYLGLVSAALWGYFAFGEVPDAATLAGAALIVGAGIYIWQRESRAARGTAA